MAKGWFQFVPRFGFSSVRFARWSRRSALLTHTMSAQTRGAGSVRPRSVRPRVFVPLPGSPHSFASLWPPWGSPVLIWPPPPSQSQIHPRLLLPVPYREMCAPLGSFTARAAAFSGEQYETRLLNRWPTTTHYSHPDDNLRAAATAAVRNISCTSDFHRSRDDPSGRCPEKSQEYWYT